MSAIEQNIPKGFKQTEVGILPQEWQILTIDEAISSKMILDQMDGNHGELYPKSHEFKDDGIPYVGATDFYSGKIDYKHCKRLPLKRAKLFKKGVAKDGDVLFAHNATVGPSSLIETHEDFIIISTTATYYRCNDEEIKNTYLLNFFRSKLFESQYSSVMSQSTRNQVPILAQRKFYLALPHIKEQTAIANALSDVDALLTELEKLIAKKQAIKTATMQQLLTGKTRLPQFATYTEGEKQGQPKGTKPSELGEIPEDWDVKDLGEYCSITKLAGFEYSNYFNSYKDGGEIIVIRGTNITHNVLNLDDIKTIPLSTSKKLPRSQLKKGDLVFAYVGTIGPVYLIEENLKYHLGPNTAKISCNSNLDENFLFSYFKSPLIRKEIEERISVGAQPSLSMGKIRSFKIIIPSSKSEQAAIAEVLTSFEGEIQTLEQRLAKTRQIKQGMMQELLTGRTRLPFDKEPQ